ncbi:uncharacterized protein TRIADDRAFT_62495 [Trichoplax adhaerens]|uniref:Uncharacterized protein n=1 Tax=Trichoplax adhaerens TaxID=10228 RepID=B3SDZ2_TRIAD|nr:hypothetical protein TRIADDRAFT_62495 [Trichoplax adhaerens]EDV19053.1 hypothetical protein TRIADDRAFT_62495 [Trichoplax adhaerens]|eukprot:XP_002118461.1 hypothetical protein TRIADDRAFT_62495 [Trichoplax adhaerens]
MASNHISVIHPEAFSSSTLVAFIDIAGCGIKKIKASLFKNLNQLTNLNIDNNEIEVINNESFLGLSYLKNLHLSGNNLRMKDISSIEFKGRILFVKKQHNYFAIDALTSKLVDKLLRMQITTIDNLLNRNYSLPRKLAVNKFPEIIFQKFPAIDTFILNLSNNRIYSGSVLNFANLTALQSMKLNNNKIKIIADDAFKSLNLERL